MPGLRAELIDLVDEIRDEVIDAEVQLRLHTVVLRRRTFASGVLGRGAITTVDVALTPRPKVREPSPRLIVESGGRYEAGDRVVDKISAAYTAADLTGGDLTADSEFLWLIDGEPYRLVSVPEEHYLGWRVHLRRMRPRPV